ncbi:MAG: hypothetical protein ABIF82_07105 [Planctomycetota bacterium]
MSHINRAVAVIRPKQPYVDWANNLPDATRPVTVDELGSDALAVLIPSYDTDEESRYHLNKLAVDIFEYELWAWCTREEWWPRKRTRPKFWEWFDVAIHSEVVDLCNAPLEREED